MREVAEETGLTVVVDEFLGWTQRLDEDHHFVILDFLASVTGPDTEPSPGGDADAAAWVEIHEIGDLDLVDGLYDFLADHDVLARTRPVDL